MSEISFARQFLSALDTRPAKLPSDHVADPRQYPAQGAYTLPKLSNQALKRKRSPTSTAPGAEKVSASVSVSLKNLKSPSSSLQLDAQPFTTSIYDLKSAYAAASGGATDKIKLLYNKKPTQDSKTLNDILGEVAEGTKDVEFTVMIMGGGGGGSKTAMSSVSSPAVEASEPDVASAASGSVAQGVSGPEVLKSAQFWDDLNGFLQQRVRDEKEAGRLTTLFKEAWEKS